MGIKVAINGFGRIGRLALRAAIERKSDIEVLAINRGEAKILAHLLKYDSVHGKAPFPIEVDKDSLLVNKKPVKVLKENDPEKLPWKQLGIDVVIESSDVFKDREGASKHLKAGAKKVVVAAPGKKLDLTVVMGVNDEIYDPKKHHLISNASCTTNCIAPVAKVLNDTYGIETGFMTTIHAYTSSQMILDRADKDLRRARAGALSIIPTTTGAASAIGEVIPELNGKLDGMAFRVPVPNVSLVDFNAILKKEVSKQEINETFRKVAKKKLKGILTVDDEPLVSVDYIHNPHSSIVDATSTMVLGNQVKVVAWYDNEYGYSCRLVDLVNKIDKLGY
ncbi:type I glyceraldehyde-3-phosphate dehydrogenase [Candidatus Bathyarchaeota archaeon]|nr:type I glyceraldehyde-3-phosphate dehydrogenase [Candidatus Bathyarchaeota archaeon]